MTSHSLNLMAQPARMQNPRTKTEDTDGDYNIWYHKKPGKRVFSRDIAETRCNILRDTGATRGSMTGANKFCLHFARGCCTRASDCTYLHRLPTKEDEDKFGGSEDIFGRERFATDRDDMGGVGSFMRDCKTLYIGGVPMIRGGVQAAEDVLFKNFAEWGELESVRVLRDKNCGFVNYVLRCAAEFAKEAMSNQSLGSNLGILNVRWATEDPNPRAIENTKRRRLEAIVREQVAQGLLSVEAVNTVIGNPINAPLPADFAERIASDKLNDIQQFTNAQLCLSYGMYPDTSSQYPDTVTHNTANADNDTAVAATQSPTHQSATNTTTDTTTATDETTDTTDTTTTPTEAVSTVEGPPPNYVDTTDNTNDDNDTQPTSHDQQQTSAATMTAEEYTAYVQQWNAWAAQYYSFYGVYPDTSASAAWTPYPQHDNNSSNTTTEQSLQQVEEGPLFGPQLPPADDNTSAPASSATTTATEDTKI
eukprot:c13179_g9_i1.p1 GENE.c13179_g9_i1~~c13179_g9_i1.p1  ORF type:complete len:478 (-),score=137.18 c13179_g9_i1:141-1574(-)